MSAPRSAKSAVYWGLRKIGRALPEEMQNVIRYEGTAEDLLRPGYEVVQITVSTMEADTRDDVRENFAAEMMKRGLATGHGDNLADLHKELWWQFDEIRNRQNVNDFDRANASLHEARAILAMDPASETALERHGNALTRVLHEIGKYLKQTR